MGSRGPQEWNNAQVLQLNHPHANGIEKQDLNPIVSPRNLPIIPFDRRCSSTLLLVLRLYHGHLKGNARSPRTVVRFAIRSQHKIRVWGLEPFDYHVNI